MFQISEPKQLKGKKTMKQNRNHNNLKLHSAPKSMYFLLTPFYVLLIIAAIYICLQQNANISNKEYTHLTECAEGISNTISEAEKIGENISKYSYISNNLNTKFELHSLMVFYENVDSFIGSISSDNIEDIIIYNNNDTLIDSKYFVTYEKLPNYDKIKKYLEENFNSTMYSYIKKDGENNLHIILYKSFLYSKDCIIAIDVKLPQKYLLPNISIKKESEINEYEISAHIINNYVCTLTPNKSEYYYFFFTAILLTALLGVFTTLTIFIITDKYINNYITDVKTYISSINSTNISKMPVISKNVETYSMLVLINDLVNRIKYYSEETYKNQLEKRRIKLEILKDHLDPHTLYNSLSAIKFHAIKNNDEDTIKLIDNMVQYYREILSKDSELITIEKEISTIEKFVLINSFSHDKNYKLEKDLPQEALNIKCLSQFLHPFVENAILHGLSGLSKECIINIKAELDGDILTIHIKDNGRGIKKEKLAMLNNLDNYSSGYGIKNSYERLRLAYGDSASIHYDSVYGEYTRVTIKYNYTKLYDCI